MQQLALLGSTGSIGRQTLDIVRDKSEWFRVHTLTANENWQLLVQQALEFKPSRVVIANDDYYGRVKEALHGEGIDVCGGIDALESCVDSSQIDTVVVALVGYSGLRPTLNALRKGKKIAIANKETLVVAGEMVMAMSRQYNAPILPVDSEHSAILQCLRGEQSGVDKIILTASGGPFRNTPKELLYEVTPQQALKHPNWVMGNKVTIDSATMMNKGLEVIEAHWLFDMPMDRIEVLVHPQSVIHSMVKFVDGSFKAQIGTPDMRIPIQYALTFPQRLPLQGAPMDFVNNQMSFHEPDNDRFPCLGIAYDVMRKGGNAPCVMNAANEVAVTSFLEGKIGFMQIPLVIGCCLDKINFIPSPGEEDYFLCNEFTRRVANEVVNNINKK